MEKEKYIKLELEDIILFENRFYKIIKSPYSNGKWKGTRPTLKLLSEKELTELLIKLNWRV